MSKEKFYLDGVSSEDVGIHLQRALMFSAAIPVFTTKHVLGRNGDLTQHEGSYENRQCFASCYALKKDAVISSIEEINKYLFSKAGYRRLQSSDDPEHFWLAQVTNGAKLEQKMRTMAPFEIKFTCKPQRFLVSGEFPIELTEPTTLYNDYGTNALPLITIYGAGPGTVTIGNTTVEVKELADQVTLDCDLQHAYRQVGDAAPENKNSTIYAVPFPELGPGENPISWTGDITHVEIIPRWWTL